ncbi:MAG: hypothetical protein KDA05_08805 [Phycisphaerales bacterium]|nr:hypothetical protein [Phycisphaerales bacterium]
MRVLFLVDGSFAARERAMLERLHVGLADEGVRIVHAVPQTLDDVPASSFFVETVGYALRGLRFSRRSRAQQLVDRIVGGPDRPIDVVHVFGESAWWLGLEIARLCGAPLALEAWRAGLVGRVRSLRASAAGGVAVGVMCPDGAGVAEYEQAGLGDAAIPAFWGVHVQEDERSILGEAVAASIVVAGSGADAKAMASAMDGVARALGPSNDARLVVDAGAARRAGLWKVLQQRGLTERASLIEDVEANRALVLYGDVLLVPEALGERRTIVLDAMGAGMAVLAAGDPHGSWVVDGETGRVVRTDADAGAAWGEAVAGVLGDVGRARALGRRAREVVGERFRASGQVAAVMAAYERLTRAGEASLAFPGA